MRHKDTELEIGGGGEGRGGEGWLSKTGGLDNVIIRSQETALTIRKNERARRSGGGRGSCGDRP